MTTIQRPIRILLNGEAIELSNVGPTHSLLTFLRTSATLTGTKEGCAEGDCGACTVVIGELRDSKLTLRTVNACLLLVPMLDGKAVFTVEYLSQSDRALHPAQQAMVEAHGSQCGFCTPGFIMSLWCCYLKHQASDKRPDRQILANALTGNLCRCTGYRPILDAADTMFDLPTVDFDYEGLTLALESLQSPDALTMTVDGVSFHSPRTLDQLRELIKRDTPSTLLAGCTDVALWINKSLRDMDDIVYLGEISELKQVTMEAHGGVRIGATVSLNDAYTAASIHYPELKELWNRFASDPVRNIGTLGGNVANGSPIGDSMPWLIAIGATVEIDGPGGTRYLSLEQFYANNLRQTSHSNHFLSAIHIPSRPPSLHFKTYKVCKRYDSDISAVCAAFALRIEDDVITQANVAFGGMAAAPKRAQHCEAALLRRSWDEQTARQAMRVLRDDFTPINDVRASANYRINTASNLLYRFFLDTNPETIGAPLQTDVFQYRLPNPSDAS